MIEIYKAILDHIECVDKFNDLNKENRERMATSLTRFSEQAIIKYIQGQKEHGGDITEKNLDKEIDQEIIDIFWYNNGRRWKEQNEKSSKK